MSEADRTGDGGRTPGLVTLSAGTLTLELAPAVGGSAAGFFLTRGGERIPLLRPAPDGSGEVLESAAYPLVPFSNRVRDGRFVFRGREVRLARNMTGQAHPLHGQGWRAPWTVAEATPDRAELAFRHEAGEWPWAYEARQTFRLDARGLDYEISVTNRSGEPMPAGLGWHPYFPCGAQTILSARVETVWTIDAETMPVAVEPAAGRYCLLDRAICGADLDNGYGHWSGEAVIRWPDRGVALRMTAPGARFFQVYAPAAGGLFVAEPVSHANDALSRPEAEWEGLGLRVLAPGGTMRLGARLEVTDDPPP